MIQFLSNYSGTSQLTITKENKNKYTNRGAQVKIFSSKIFLVFLAFCKSYQIFIKFSSFFQPVVKAASTNMLKCIKMFPFLRFYIYIKKLYPKMRKLPPLY